MIDACYCFVGSQGDISEQRVWTRWGVYLIRILFKDMPLPGPVLLIVKALVSTVLGWDSHAALC